MALSPQHLVTAALLATSAISASALDWSDTRVGYRYGTQFAEPYNATNISKSIFNLTHASGYRYGTQFFNADLLLSNSKDPANVGSHDGARELYVLYRHTLDLSKLSGIPLAFGPIRSLGLTGGVDWNAKEDAGYNSRKQMLVAGPTLMLEVPGFLNVSLLQLWESNSPYNGFTRTHVERYHYDPHPMLNLAWGIPFQIGPLPLSFEGYANFIAAKGKNEFGGESKPETNIDLQVMYDLAPLTGAAPKTFTVGLAYQYWKNKFGNDHRGPAGQGAFARTPMIRAEYHF